MCEYIQACGVQSTWGIFLNCFLFLRHGLPVNLELTAGLGRWPARPGHPQISVSLALRLQTTKPGFYMEAGDRTHVLMSASQAL